MTRVAFSPKILESYGEFEKYLESTEAIERIREEAKKPYVPGEARLGALSVTWLAVSFPLRAYYTIFLAAMGNLLYYASPLGKQGLYLYAEAWQQANYLLLPFEYLLHDNLVDCMNCHSHDAYEIYTQEPISLDAVSIDWQVEKHLHEAYIDEKKRLAINGWDGQCSGMSDWIAHLYRETKHDFSDPEHHLVSIVKQVRGGASREAALLQPCCNYDYPALGLNKYKIEHLEGATAEKIREAFEALGPGFYGVIEQKAKDSSSSHRINVVATSDSLYLIEPNSGLSKTTPEKLGKRLEGNYQVRIDEV